MSIPAQIKYIVFTLLFIVATVNFARTTLNILHSSKRLDDLKAEVTTLEDKKTELQKTIEYKSTQEFIEERARNALNLIKPGEKVFVMPAVLAASSDKVSGISTEKEMSNFQKWIELFL
jgi:cell division protein FtsB